MNKIWNFLFIMVTASGCTTPRLEMTQDSTGSKTCRTQFNHLKGASRDDEGELILKHTQGEHSEPSPRIKGLLKTTQKGKREYVIHPDEVLNLYVDEIRYPLEIANTFKDPGEVMEQYHVATPSGAVIPLGFAKEVTTRQIAFFMDDDLLTKLSNAKTARLDLVSTTKSSNGSSIILAFQSQNLHVIQEFKNKCVKPLP